MKIAIFTPYNIFLPGGVQEHVQYEAQLLRARGHNVTVLTPRPRLKKTEDAPDGVVFLGTSARIKTPSATSGDVSISLDNDAIDDVLEQNYDIIQVHEPFVPIAARQILGRVDGRSIRVGTFHAALPGNALGKTLITTYRTYARTMLPLIDAITAVSPAAIGYIDSLAQHPISYIPNGIQLSMYKPKKLKRDQNMILFIGRLEKRKGALQAIKAFEYLKKELKPEATLKIAGDGPLRDSLENYVREHRIPNVEFLGFIDSKTKVDLLNRCGIYTSPALYGESFGIVLAEAMAMQAPIVAHPNEGYSWVMKSTGRLSLVNCKDPEAYAHRMQLMLEDQELRTAWQKWAATYVRQFAYERVVDQYEELFERLLRQK